MSNNTLEYDSAADADECKKTQFVLIAIDEFCVFVSQHDFQLINNFYFAVEKAITWGDFWSICHEDTRNFCTTFMQCDEYFPSSDQLMEDIKEDIWILYDGDFPQTQCIEETTSKYGELFPEEYRVGHIFTEYGEKIYLFSGDKIDELVDSARSRGLLVTRVNEPYTIMLNNYGY